MKVLCSTCDVTVSGGSCVNFWCARDDRAFDVVWAVGEHGGEVRRAIAALKYRGERSRADWLARMLARFLCDRGPAFDDVDLIVGTPGCVTPERPLDHIREIMGALDDLVGHLWELDARRPVIRKRAPTRSMVELSSAASRRLWAAGELRPALAVIDASRIRGRRVLVVDDVFTDGSTMREVAMALRLAGAAAVSGLVVARRPLLPQTSRSTRPW